MAQDVVKRIAVDGSQRGLHRGPQRRTRLIDEIKAAVEKDSGIVDWDPVLMLSIIAARAFTGYPAVDEDGNPILDEAGNQVIVPPDFAMAAAAASKVAPYVYSQLRPKDPEVEEADKASIKDERRERIAAAFSRMGIEVKYKAKKPRRKKPAKEIADGS